MQTQVISIPTDWSEVTLAQYRTYTLEVLTQKDLSKSERMVRTVQIFSGAAMDSLYQTTVQAIEKAYEKIMQLIAAPRHSGILPIVKLGGRRFGFHPKLAHMTFGELADLETFLQDGAWESMPEILTVLYRPVTEIRRRKYRLFHAKVKDGQTGQDRVFSLGFGKRGLYYSIEKYQDKHNDNQELMLSMTMDVVWGAHAFFLDIGNSLLQSSTQSTLNEIQKRTKRTRQKRS